MTQRANNGDVMNRERVDSDLAHVCVPRPINPSQRYEVRGPGAARKLGRIVYGNVAVRPRGRRREFPRARY